MLIHNHWSSGYHHWITEALVRLLAVDTSQYHLIIPEDYPQFAFDSLTAFEFLSIIKLPKGTGCIVSGVTIPPNPKSGYYQTEQLLQLKKKLTANSNPLPSYKNIYVSRKNASMRKIENETAVIDLLKQYDFEIIYAEDLTFEEQVILFSQCKLLLSIHGAALTNCLFMPSTGMVLELYREKNTSLPEMNYCYQRQTKALGLNHRYIFCKTGENLGSHIDKVNLSVNLQQLQEAIEIYS